MIENNNNNVNAPAPMEKDRLTDSLVSSLSNLLQYELDIAPQSIRLCIDILHQYADRLEPKKGIAPVIPYEIESVIALLNKVSKDMDVVRDVIEDDKKALAAVLAP